MRRRSLIWTHALGRQARILGWSRELRQDEVATRAATGAATKAADEGWSKSVGELKMQFERKTESACGDRGKDVTVDAGCDSLGAINNKDDKSQKATACAFFCRRSRLQPQPPSKHQTGPPLPIASLSSGRRFFSNWAEHRLYEPWPCTCPALLASLYRRGVVQESWRTQRRSRASRKGFANDMVSGTYMSVPLLRHGTSR